MGEAGLRPQHAPDYRVGKRIGLKPSIQLADITLLCPTPFENEIDGFIFDFLLEFVGHDGAAEGYAGS
jgi:hypothetical protein